jgi:hypothetical protein
MDGRRFIFLAALTVAACARRGSTLRAPATDEPSLAAKWAEHAGAATRAKTEHDFARVRTELLELEQLAPNNLDLERSLARTAMELRRPREALAHLEAYAAAGLVVRLGAFWFLAASGWSRFDETGQRVKDPPPDAPTVWRVPLDLRQ